ncbi:MAG TPA: HAD family hydrolase [Actinomycetales bacterium]|nr:HAD family hydrolase [Actinomycetales bacterium]
MSAPRARPALVALDLDGTLLYSARSLMLGDDDLLAPRLVVAEVWRGEPLTYCTQRTETLLAELARAAVVVPVTTRTRAQYARVRLFDGSGPGSAPAFAVVANGGHLLVDGRPDEDWARQVRAAVAAECAPLDEVTGALERTTDGHRTSELRAAEGLFTYVAVDPATWPGSALADLAAWCAERGWRVSLQGRRLYCVPRPLTKAAAVAEVARRTGTARLLAAGDSLLDRDVLALADNAVRPPHGELHEIGWRPPHVTVTATAGVRAGEEVVRRLLELLRHPPSDEIVSTDALQ